MSALRLTAIAHRTALFAALWFALAGTAAEGLAAEGLIAGAGAVAAAVWLSLRLVPARRPLALWRLAGHLPRFLWGSLVGGIDVSRRALAPRLRLRPGWRMVPLDLPDGGRVALGAELSLMPGTLAAGSDGARLVVHLLDTEAGFDAAIEVQAAEIAAILNHRRAPDDPATGNST